MPEFMTASQTAERLGVSVARVYQLIREARLPHIRRGRRVLVPVDAWQHWVREQSKRALDAVTSTD